MVADLLFYNSNDELQRYEKGPALAGPFFHSTTNTLF